MQSAQCNIWSTCSRIMSHDDDDDDDAVVIAVSLCLQKTKTILAPYLTVLASVTTPTLSSHHACHSASSSLQGRRAPTPQPPSSARGPPCRGHAPADFCSLPWGKDSTAGQQCPDHIVGVC